MYFWIMNFDEKIMLKCIELAKKGMGNVFPNPMVGSIIVYNKKIIGQGYHQEYGKNHAELNAINSVTDKKKLKDSTIYINLEPCSHYNNTPPCAELIIKNQIKNVIIGSQDPFHLVSGNGIKKLKKHCNVLLGVCEKECKKLNHRFFIRNKYKRPFIILKWAQSKDGFINGDTLTFYFFDDLGDSLIGPITTELIESPEFNFTGLLYEGTISGVNLNTNPLITLEGQETLEDVDFEPIDLTQIIADPDDDISQIEWTYVGNNVLNISILTFSDLIFSNNISEASLNSSELCKY